MSTPINKAIKKSILENIDDLIWEKRDLAIAGIPRSEIERVFNDELLAEFHQFMEGRTVGSLNDKALYWIGDVRDFLKRN